MVRSLEMKFKSQEWDLMMNSSNILIPLKSLNININSYEYFGSKVTWKHYLGLTKRKKDKTTFIYYFSFSSVDKISQKNKTLKNFKRMRISLDSGYKNL
jgi:hypothetical protein